VNTGVPHAVVFVEDIEDVDVRRFGSGLRYHTHFAPKGTNANFMQQLGPQTIAIRTYERGVEDETLACGTGMVACALIFRELTGAPSPVGVKVRGGETLEIAFRQEGKIYRDVTLTGPADFVFDGQTAL
jgi:diaminopimelate epimerase